MPDSPIVVVSESQAKRVRPHFPAIEQAGGVIRPADLTDPSSRRQALAEATCAIVALNTFEEADFAAAPQLRAVVSMSIGVDSIDLAAATRHGVMVGNVPDLCIDEVADHTLLLLLACYRRLPQTMASQRAGENLDRLQLIATTRPWPRLRGQTAGLLGLGNIARAVAARCQACGLRVIAHDPYVDPGAASAVELVTFDELLARSDYLSVHVPLTPDTHHRLDAAAFAAMQPTAFFINTARGPIVDEPALVHALTTGQIAGAGLDVFEVEPPERDNPLLVLPNVIATPHTAGYSDEGTAWAPESVVNDAVAVLRGGRLRSIQNPAVLNVIEAGASG